MILIDCLENIVDESQCVVGEVNDDDGAKCDEKNDCSNEDNDVQGWK